jgi:hypothetical protein
MHLVYLNMLIESDFNDPESYIYSSHIPQTFLRELQGNHSFKISVIQRATFTENTEIEGISFSFMKDEFPGNLRWWQEPESTLQHLAALKPDIVHVKGLNLPLQFRWLRRMVGDTTVIVGEHTGEDFWAQRNLWLQQFGLRAVDGFIFKNPEDANLWRKTSLVLEHQPLIEISSLKSDHATTAEKLIKFYINLMSTKNSDESVN